MREQSHIAIDPGGMNPLLLGMYDLGQMIRRISGKPPLPRWLVPALVPAGPAWDGLCNAGGGGPPPRREHITSSIFAPRGGVDLGGRLVGGTVSLGGGASGRLLSGRRRSLALKALKVHGFSDPQQAFRNVSDIPGQRLHCVDDGEDRQSPEGPESLHFLRAALILGKCRDGLYDPARPVVWTEGRLSRSVRLYGIGGNFYTDDEAVSLSGGHGKANT
jgi:hypothetical protein